MRNASEAYNEEIRDLFKREIDIKVQIDYSDPEIAQGIEVIAQENRTSYSQQVVDGNEDMTHAFASLDGSWKLEQENHYLAPSSMEIGLRMQYGLWGSQLSDENGNFAIPPIVTVTFISRPMRDLKLIGDNKRNEYPVDFDFKLYDTDGIEKYVLEVRGNNEVHWNYDIPDITNISKMEIHILKWNLPNRVIKIVELFTSIQEVYNKDDIISIRLTEEREVINAIPIGNISSNEVEITLLNNKGKFDVGNINSPLYGLVKANRMLRAWIGTKSQLIPLGLFWSIDWDIATYEKFAKVVGRDRLERLRKTDYTSSQVEINKSVYDLAESILLDVGLNHSHFILDEELKDIIIPYAYFKPSTHRECLRLLAEASAGQVYCDREGYIRFEGPSFMERKGQKIDVTAFLQSDFPAETESLDIYGIGENEIFKKTNPSKISKMANRVIVDTNPLTLKPQQEIYRNNEPIILQASVIKKEIIYFNTTPCIDVTLSVTGNAVILNSKIYAWGAEIELMSANNVNDIVLTAIGKPLVIENRNSIIVENAESIVDNGIVEYKVTLNHLIQNSTMAQNIADRILEYFSEAHRDLELNWRGNPALELGDVIMVDDYKNKEEGLEIKGLYYITSNGLEYEGGLTANLTGRRMFKSGMD